MQEKNEIYYDIRKIDIAHEFTLDRVRKCEYPGQRGSYGLIYPLKGRAQYRFSSGETIELGVGECLLISPKSSYYIVTEGDFRHYTVNFDINEENSRGVVTEGGYILTRPDIDRPLEGTFARLVDAFRDREAGYEMRAVGLLYGLIADFYGAVRACDTVDERDRLSVVREYLQKSFDKQITLAELAHLSNMSLTNFRRLWAKRYGDTPIRYRDSVRLYYARLYLKCGYYTVGEVALKCGFSDVAYFIRFFKSHTGTSPKRYKESPKD